jgi:hypothetical protein
MNEDLEQLKALGVQKVHEDTHISRKNIEGIFSQSFEGMNPVQFAGFISILEREYGLELATLKRSFLAYWEERYGSETEETRQEESSASSTKRGGKLVLGLVAATLAGVLFYMGGDSGESHSKPVAAETAVVAVETPVPEEAQAIETPEVAVAETAATAAQQSEEEVAAAEGLSIIPKTQLWIGLIDLETYKREQELTSEPVVLDANRSWLMIFGHGHFKVQQGEEILDFSSDNRLRFIYENGTLREITRSEFKERNRGQNW